VFLIILLFNSGPGYRIATETDIKVEGERLLKRRESIASKRSGGEELIASRNRTAETYNRKLTAIKKHIEVICLLPCI
jgi:hypothetical protein